MIDYNSLDIDKKQDFKLQLLKHATQLGGRNRFLSLIEELRFTSPHPLNSKDKCFRSKNIIIQWEKIIFKDKVDLLVKLNRKIVSPC